MKSSSKFRLLIVATIFAFATGPVARASEESGAWQLAESRAERGVPFVLYVEEGGEPGRPGFKIETTLAASPDVAAAVLMESMLAADDLPGGDRREVLERTERGALVYSFVDLPFMLSDREVALRIHHEDDPSTGVHRVSWRESNHELPPSKGKAVRIEGTNGYWEFSPLGAQRCEATYLTRAEPGGSIPAAIADRLMKKQAVEAVERLRGKIEMRRVSDVAGGPPAEHASD